MCAPYGKFDLTAVRTVKVIGSQTFIFSTSANNSSVSFQIIPYVKNIYFKDLKQTLRREQIDVSLINYVTIDACREARLLINGLPFSVYPACDGQLAVRKTIQRFLRYNLRCPTGETAG